jgi:hypothetical protein
MKCLSGKKMVKLRNSEKPNYFVFLAFSFLVVIFESYLHNRESGSRPVDIKTVIIDGINCIFSFSLVWLGIKRINTLQKLNSLFALCLVGSSIYVLIEIFYRIFIHSFHFLSILDGILLPIGFIGKVLLYSILITLFIRLYQYLEPRKIK